MRGSRHAMITAQVVGGYRDCAGDLADGEGRGHAAERHVHGHEHDAEPAPGEHHANGGRAGQILQELGVAADRKAGARDPGLVDRRGDDAGDRAGARASRVAVSM